MLLETAQKELETYQLQIPGFGSRRFRLYRPSGSIDGRPRPLLLLFDGQNVFDDAGSYAGGWHAHEAIEKLARRRPRPFLVGLDHGGEARIDELSPYPTKWGSGRADALLEWMAHTFLPLLRKELPIVEGPAGVVLGGSSMGGLAAFYGHLRFPEAFGGALAMSPSFGVAGKPLTDFVQHVSKPRGTRVYLDIGVREGRLLVERMKDLLVERGYSDGDLKVVIDKKGQHNERCWRRRLPGALRFFFD